MNIGDRQIGPDFPPFIIAEMSNNHLGDIDRAVAIIDAAVAAGADAVKIQTYDADSLTIDCDKPDFVIQDPLWRGRTYYDLYHDISAPRSWTAELFRYARSRNILLFSSPFDKASIDILEKENCPAYKIASFEARDPELLQQVAATGKPVIMSTGVSSWDDICESLNWLKESGARDIALLHCVSSYPSSEKDMNLAVLKRLATLPVLIGLSDHSLGMLASNTAVSLGASVIEKHFTLARADGGPDAEFSLEPDEFRTMAEQARLTWQAIGSDAVLEQPVRAGCQHSRSIYAVRDIAAGQLLTDGDVRVIRPGFGLAPKYLPRVIGRTAAEAIERGTAIHWEMLS